MMLGRALSVGCRSRWNGPGREGRQDGDQRAGGHHRRAPVGMGLRIRDPWQYPSRESGVHRMSQYGTRIVRTQIVPRRNRRCDCRVIRHDRGIRALIFVVLLGQDRGRKCPEERSHARRRPAGNRTHSRRDRPDPRPGPAGVRRELVSVLQARAPKLSGLLATTRGFATLN